MPKPINLEHKYKLVASNPAHEDFCQLLEEEANFAADVRSQLNIAPELDGLPVRLALSTRLKEIIDKIRRVRKNEIDPGIIPEDNEDI